MFVLFLSGFNAGGTWPGRGPAECAAELEGFRMVKSAVTYKTSNIQDLKIRNDKLCQNMSLFNRFAHSAGLGRSIGS